MQHCNGMCAVICRRVLVDQSFIVPYVYVLRLQDDTGWQGAALA